jgi:hypothetical protein
LTQPSLRRAAACARATHSPHAPTHAPAGFCGRGPAHPSRGRHAHHSGGGVPHQRWRVGSARARSACRYAHCAHPLASSELISPFLGADLTFSCYAWVGYALGARTQRRGPAPLSVRQCVCNSCCTVHNRCVPARFCSIIVLSCRWGRVHAVCAGARPARVRPPIQGSVQQRIFGFSLHAHTARAGHAAFHVVVRAVGLQKALSETNGLRLTHCRVLSIDNTPAWSVSRLAVCGVVVGRRNISQKCCLFLTLRRQWCPYPDCASEIPRPRPAPPLMTRRPVPRRVPRRVP